MPPLRRFPVLLLALALISTACGGGEDSRPVGDREPLPARNAATAPLLPTDALALPDFDLETYGRLIEQLRGTPVLVNIWASWCGPCEEEAPHLAAAAKSYGTRVQFLGVDILDTRAEAVSFMVKHGWTYPSVYDANGSIRDGLGFLGQPVTLFYDASGKLAGSWQGAIPSEELTRRLDELVSS